MVYFSTNCSISFTEPSLYTNHKSSDICFLCFVTAKDQSNFPAVRLSCSINENAKDKDILLDEAEGTNLEVIPETQKETPIQKVSVNENDEDIQKNDLLVAVTPDRKCVGIKVKHGIPESFDTDESHQEWLKQAAERAISLKDRIESGSCSVESVKDQLDVKPNLTMAIIDKLVAKSRAG